MRFCISVILISTANGQLSWPTQQESESDTQPSIEVRLAPPARPLPEVAAEIGLLEASRASSEEAAFIRLQAAYNQALQVAKARIGDVVNHAAKAAVDGKMSRVSDKSTLFLQRDQGKAVGHPSVRVSVLPASPPDPSLKSGIDAIEEKRSAMQEQLFMQAATEMSGLTTVILSELESQLQSHADSVLAGAALSGLPPAPSRDPVSFAEAEVSQGSESGPHGLNVRVGASDVPYPTVAGLVRDMEFRRDASEELARQRILEMFMKLLKAENAMIKQALRVSFRGGVTQAPAQY